jgi:hypothetical protein
MAEQSKEQASTQMVHEPKRKNQMEVNGAKEWMIHGVCKNPADQIKN